MRFIFRHIQPKIFLIISALVLQNVINTSGGIKIISIIIPFSNHYDLTKRCLEKLVEHTKHISYEVLLIDNASKQSQYSDLEKILKGRDYKIFRLNKKLSFSQVNNYGVSKAKYSYVCFLNNDVFFQNNCLFYMLREFERRDDVVAVGARLYYPPWHPNKKLAGNIQHIGLFFSPKDGEPLHISKPNPPRSTILTNLTRKCYAVTAALMVVDKEIFQETNGFSTEYENGYEDVDFCLNVHKKGYDIIYCAEAFAYHKEKGTRKRLEGFGGLQILLKKWQKYIYKNILQK